MTIYKLKLRSFERMGLNEVPIFTGKYPHLITIDLGDNRIERIRERSLGSDQTPMLREIILSNNRISNIEKDAFAGLLVTIDLASNQLNKFSFSPYTRVQQTLELLNLRENRIREFRFNTTFFNGTNNFPNLILDISDNPIECESITPSELPFIPLCEPFFESFQQTQAECVDSESTLADICSLFTNDNDNGGEDTDDNTDNDNDEDRDDNMPERPTTPDPNSDSSLGIIIGSSVGVPVVLIVLLVMFLVLMFIWRSKTWERKFQDVTEAQVEATFRLSHTMRAQDPYSADPRYATRPIKTIKFPPDPLSPYFNPLTPFPGPSSTIFLPDTDTEDMYSSIDTRPLPAVPPQESDYEDGYILTVASAPRRDVLPGIVIAKRREKEAERLSLYPAPVLKSKQKDLIPSTSSDSETEIEHDVPFSHQLNTGSGFGTENTLPISEQNIGVTVSEEKDMQTLGKDQIQGDEVQALSRMDGDRGKENPTPNGELLSDVDNGSRDVVCGEQEDVYLSIVQ
ncbi:uncharacterized protein LOC135343057 isoform X2 [Halichondria panicea]|uniref:uncharacterized protein LOC135343057 isoform X2 n=1 Tax=Halichondria panicea TaxID=6063 RepID=UPI00312BA2AB